MLGTPNPSPIPAPTGLADMANLLELLKDAKTYKAKIQEFETARDEANQAIANLGLAGDIVRARQQAADNEAATAKRLEEAKAEAEEIIRAAKDAGERRRHEMNLAVKKQAAEFDKRHAELEEMGAEIVEQRAALDAAKAELAVAQENLAARQKTLGAQIAFYQQGQADLDKAKAEVDARLAKLRSVMA